MKTFKEFINEGPQEVNEKIKSKTIKTKKSVVTSVDIVKYKDGSYGILSWGMGKEERKFLEANGFKIDKNTHYPYRVCKDEEELRKVMKDLFGVELPK